MKFNKWISSTLIVAFGALAFTGCEASVGGDKIDTDSVESSMTAQYPGKTGGLKLTEVSCDEGDAKVDATFNCTATNDVGSKLEIEATVTKVDGSDVKFTWHTTKTVAKGSAFADVATTTLQNQGSAVTSIKCPEEIDVKEGNEVDCTATMDNGLTQDVKLTLTDGSGAFNANLSGPTP